MAILVVKVFMVVFCAAVLDAGDVLTASTKAVSVVDSVKAFGT